MTISFAEQKGIQSKVNKIVKQAERAVGSSRVSHYKIVAKMLDEISLEVEGRVKNEILFDLLKRINDQITIAEKLTGTIEKKTGKNTFLIEPQYKKAVACEKAINDLAVETDMKFNVLLKEAAKEGRNLNPETIDEYMRDAALDIIVLNGIIYSRGGDLTPMVSELCKESPDVRCHILKSAAYWLSSMYESDNFNPGLRKRADELIIKLRNDFESTLKETKPKYRAEVKKDMYYQKIVRFAQGIEAGSGR